MVVLRSNFTNTQVKVNFGYMPCTVPELYSCFLQVGASMSYRHVLIFYLLLLQPKLTLTCVLVPCVQISKHLLCVHYLMERNSEKENK
jgi:hypothetical protein